MTPLRTAGWAAFVVALFLPCFWTARVQGGDLGSHVFNAWLVQEVKAHPVAGVEVTTQFHNVLFDVVLEYALKVTGSPDLAARIGVALALACFTGGVLIWTGFQLSATPLLLLLAHGWVLQAGFLNFYASAGLMLGALGMWRRNRIAAVLLALLAVSAHLLGVAMALTLALVIALHRRFGWVSTGVLAVVAVVAQMQIGDLYATDPSRYPWLTLDALHLCVAASTPLMAAFLLLQLALLVARRGEARREPAVGGWIFALLLGASASSALQLPFFSSPLTFLYPRFAFLVGIAFVAAASALAPLPRWFVGASMVMVSIFGFNLWQQHAWLSQTQLAMERAVATVPHGARVVSTITESGRCLNAVIHLVDMACAGGRCMSWGNYEPSSSHFRLRQTGDKEVVALNAANGQALEGGGYVAREADLPLYLLNPVPGTDRFHAAPVGVGERLPSIPVCRICN